MTTRQRPEILVARDEMAPAPLQRSCNDQTFELPGGLYIAMALCSAGFIAVLSLAFRGHMAVSFGVIFAFLGAYFGVPALLPYAGGRDGRAKALNWFEFRHRGIATATGRTSVREATILVLLLPFLILCFGIAVVTIAALV